MNFKKISLIIFICTSLLCLASEHSKQNSQPEIMLTLEEVEQLIKDIEQDPQLAKNTFPKAHTKKGLEKIIECINNFDECEHPAILGANNKEHKNSIQIRNNQSVYISQVKNGKSDLENRIDFFFEDLYGRSFYNQTKKNIHFNLALFEALLVIYTTNFYMYLHGYLQKKRSIQK